MATSDLSWQPSLLDVGDRPGIDASFSRLERVELDPQSWVDYAPGWVAGSDLLFDQLLGSTRWGQRSRQMYDRRVLEPRLTWSWRASSGTPLQPELLEEIRGVLSRRYVVDLDSAGLNLYRDGADSVAWHRDRIAAEVQTPIVALVSVGEPRKFLLRPHQGGRSRTFMLGRGDLLVTGGLTQRTWEHSVPKTTAAGPRISIAYRHGMKPPPGGEARA